LGAKALGDFRLFIGRERWLDGVCAPAGSGEGPASCGGGPFGARIRVRFDLIFRDRRGHKVRHEGTRRLPEIHGR
jgi:hypothetical protein